MTLKPRLGPLSPGGEARSFRRWKRRAGHDIGCWRNQYPKPVQTPTLSVTGISPAIGAPGTVVDLRGVGFTPTSSVQFNGVAAAAVSYVSSTELEATVPSAATPAHRGVWSAFAAMAAERLSLLRRA
jgi:hypothetical protein